MEFIRNHFFVLGIVFFLVLFKMLIKHERENNSRVEQISKLLPQSGDSKLEVIKRNRELCYENLKISTLNGEETRQVIKLNVFYHYCVYLNKCKYSFVFKNTELIYSDCPAFLSENIK